MLQGGTDCEVLQAHLLAYSLEEESFLRMRQKVVLFPYVTNSRFCPCCPPKTCPRKAEYSCRCSAPSSMILVQYVIRSWWMEG
jgi:NADH pyrophosphatase NudC (nudix superfamily)